MPPTVDSSNCLADGAPVGERSNGLSPLSAGLTVENSKRVKPIHTGTDGAGAAQIWEEERRRWLTWS